MALRVRDVEEMNESIRNMLYAGSGGGAASLSREIVVDNFAGGGGASSGIELATGRSVDIAINHDQAAIDMHKANHPDTEHYCEDVWDVDPRKATGGRPVALCWLSPDCKHFSKAKGGKPVEKKIRGLAWIALRWAATVKPRVIILENVEEFQTWGPLTKDGQPDPKQKGRTFRSFVNALKRQGYKVEWNEMRACDFGAPTIRKRLFLIARCDGEPIVWPKPTHGHPDSAEVKTKKLKPWRTAAEIIDWTIPCPSIFGRKKPLAENTMRRIARGIMKFVVNNPKPFIIKVNHAGHDFRGQPMDEPLQTMTAKNGYGIVTPFLAQVYGTSIGHTADSPHATVTSKQKSQYVAAFLSKYHGETTGNEARGQKIDDPLYTLDTSNRFALNTVFLAKHFGGNYTGAGNGVDEPLSTVTAKDHSSLVTANLMKYYGQGEGQVLNDPLHTIRTKDSFSLVTSHLIKMRRTNIGQPVTEPLHTITSGGLHLGEVRAFLRRHLAGEEQLPLQAYAVMAAHSFEEHIAEAKMRHLLTDLKASCQQSVQRHMEAAVKLGLIEINGEVWQIVDIGMRMLEPHELFAAQGFPPTYKIDRDRDGNKIPKSKQVARCGNSVPPPFAEHLVRANLPELCMVPGGYTSVANLRVGQMNMFDEAQVV